MSKRITIAPTPASAGDDFVNSGPGKDTRPPSPAPSPTPEPAAVEEKPVRIQAWISKTLRQAYSVECTLADTSMTDDIVALIEKRVEEMRKARGA
ncbi:hypothetical protein [Novosphingobium sp. TCA1]|uniref:hypothetical protein n=1 Tax=Novosphingobium sp. TCA1 TaxID=2682474 RepID=UPI001306CC94|nr:hypothetical protein [Novosphingobium sp. TCA1]GFE77722.1 hypothetical protein NTCA1_53710 [Novosphingobium sp. TCA1]